MNKKVIIFTVTMSSIVLAILLVFSGIAIFYKPHYAPEIDTLTSGKVEFVIEEGKTPYLVKKNEANEIIDTPFKIATSADLHLHSEMSDLTLAVISNFIDKEKPDLFVFLGDNIIGASNTIMQDKLKQLFEDKEQYWGFVLGNHDGETYDGTVEEKRQWAYNALVGGEHCVVYDEGGYEIAGAGNCTVNIKNSSGMITQTLFFIDNASPLSVEEREIYKPSGAHNYGYIKQDQIDWYNRRLNELTAENSGILPKSIVFVHIPLPEYETAYNSLNSGNEAILNYGNNFEKVCYSVVNAGFFEVIKNSNSTHTIICGHDHTNDTNITYQGVRLVYSQSLSYESYNRRNNVWFKFCYFLNRNNYFFTDGITIFMIKSDSSVDVTARYVQDPEILSSLEEYCDLGKYHFFI